MSKGRKQKDNKMGFIIAYSFVALGILFCAIMAILFNQGVI